MSNEKKARELIEIMKKTEEFTVEPVDDGKINFRSSDGKVTGSLV